MVEHALAAAERLSHEHGLATGVYSARFAKPLDERLIVQLISTGKPLLIVEDHAVACGFGSAVMELASAKSLHAPNVKLLGLPDRFIAHANRSEQLTEVGLDADSLARALLRHLEYQAVSQHTRS
jgi:1-deoxy-D-xylulose-5-phosphate synthase